MLEKSFSGGFPSAQLGRIPQIIHFELLSLNINNNIWHS